MKLIKVPPIERKKCVGCYYKSIRGVDYDPCPKPAQQGHPAVTDLLCAPYDRTGLRKHLHIYVEDTPENRAAAVARRLTT